MLAASYEIKPAILKHPAMSGDLRDLMDDGIATALIVADKHRAQLEVDVPAEEWHLETTNTPWGARTATIIAPRQGRQNTAYLAAYRPPPEKDRSGLGKLDWNDTQPSPNPGLLAYFITERLTAVSIPMICKPGVRHDCYRHLFVELNDATGWLHGHNNPGYTLAEEREMIEQLRQAMR